MSKINQVNFKCDTASFEALARFAKAVDRTLPDFTRLCIEACLRMVDDPEARIIPPVIQDAIDRIKRTQVPLSEKQQSLSAEMVLVPRVRRLKKSA